MIRSLRSLIAPAFAVLALGLATDAQAAFTVTLGTVNPTTVTIGLTTITLTPSAVTQTFQTGPNGTFGSNVNIINVAINSLTTGNSTPDSGSFTFTEVLTITGSGVNAGQNETVTFNGTFNLTQGYQGAIQSSVTGTFFSGASSSSYTTSFFGYAAPSPTSSGGAGGNGNITLTITPVAPAAVPEPASVVMMGLGLVGTLGFAARRRLA